MHTHGRDWLRVPMAFLLGLLAFALAAPTSRLLGRLLPMEIPEGDWLGTTLFQIMLGVFAVLFMLILGRGNLRRFGFQRGGDWHLVRVALVLLVAHVLIALAFLPFPRTGPGHFAGEFAWWQVIIGILIVASTIEEVVARGLVQTVAAPLAQRGLRFGRLFLSVPVLTGALYFSAMHIPLLIMGIDPIQGIEILVGAFALGLIAGHAREASGSLGPAIVAHILANLYGMGLDELFGQLGIG